MVTSQTLQMMKMKAKLLRMKMKIQLCLELLSLGTELLPPFSSTRIKIMILLVIYQSISNCSSPNLINIFMFQAADFFKTPNLRLQLQTKQPKKLLQRIAQLRRIKMMKMMIIVHQLEVKLILINTRRIKKETQHLETSKR